MTVKYLREQRITGVIAEIAKLKFPFPNETNPDYETFTNNPKPTIAVGQFNGADVFPDIVVVRRPGQWLMMMAQVESENTLTDDVALARWLPASKCGELFIYVPMGSAGEAKKLAKKHNIQIRGVRTWRFRPVWGLEVTEA